MTTSAELLRECQHEYSATCRPRCLSGVLLAAFGFDAVILAEEDLIIDTAGGPMTVFVCRPAAVLQPPVVIVYQDGPGVRPDLYDMTRRLAGAGYVGVLPDLYHRYGDARRVDMAKMERADPAEITKVLSMIDGLDDSEVLAETNAILLQLTAVGIDCRLVGCLGLCVGARFMLRAMAAFPETMQAGAGLHPSFIIEDGPHSPHLDVRYLRGELYFGYGALDHVVPPESLQPLWDEIACHGVRAEVDRFAAAGHAFMFPGLPFYRPADAEQAWHRMLALFARTLHAPESPAATTMEN